MLKVFHVTASWSKIGFCIICTLLCYLSVFLLTISTMSRFQYEQLDVFMDIRMYRLILFLALVGTLCLMLAFIGFVGIWIGNRTVLHTFCWLLIIFSCLETTVAFIGYKQRHSIETQMESNLWYSVNNYPTDVNLQSYVDLLQMQVQCCGVNNYTDWLKEMPPDDITTHDKDIAALFVPLSCCDLTDNEKCSIFEAGCQNKMYDILYEVGHTVIVYTLMAIVIQLCAAACMLLLLPHLKFIKPNDENVFQTDTRSSFGYTKLQNIRESSDSP
ncbi:CD63 antigen-like [Anopheles nili]|uniref:CD63 antigen-like n=1 Tax=Anopheles nili TaxID=185578 RepID=UPI00237B727C|nr:CD63 antigen-like [Anopheles nili]